MAKALSCFDICHITFNLLEISSNFCDLLRKSELYLKCLVKAAFSDQISTSRLIWFWIKSSEGTNEQHHRDLVKEIMGKNKKYKVSTTKTCKQYMTNSDHKQRGKGPAAPYPVRPARPRPYLDFEKWRWRPCKVCTILKTFSRVKCHWDMYQQTCWP